MCLPPVALRPLPLIYLHKILPVFLLPTGLILGLLLLGLISRRRSPIWVTVLLFWLCSTFLLSDRLIAAVEHIGYCLDPTSLPTADAIVVLSGSLKTMLGPDATGVR